MNERVLSFTTPTFQALVALNNMAVTMMKRGCCRQAYKTLKDAVLMVKRQASARRQSLVQASVGPSIVMLFQKAEERNTSPEILSFRSTCVKVVSHDSVPKASDFLSPNRVAGQTRYCLIRIEEQEFYETSPDREASELLAAIILYNLGVVLLFRATISTKDILIRHLRAKAIYLMKASQRLLASLYSNSENIFLIPRELFASVVLLRTLIQVYEASGEDDEVRTCRLNLEQLKTLLMTWGFPSNLAFKTAAAAA